LDAYAGLDEAREAFLEGREEYLELRVRLEELRTTVSEQARQMELITFQLEEIEALDPGEGEIEELEKEIHILQSAERLAAGVRAMVDDLAEGEGPLLDRLGRVEDTASEVVEIDPSLGGTEKLLADARLALQEAVHTAQRYLDGIDLDQRRLDSLRDRQSAVILMAKKYGGSMDALLTRRAELREEVAKQEQASSDLPELERHTEEARKRASDAALKLSDERARAARRLEKNVERELLDLAMQEAVFRIDVQRAESHEGWVADPNGALFDAGPTGIDRVEYILRTNPGGPLLPLRRIASGGEISRIMLALKSVFGVASQVPTLVFDEIDSGIGGQTADQVGQKLEDLSRQHQVVVITHLPQIARRGRRHIVVEKLVENGRALSRIRHVEGTERTRALAVLMGGDAEDATAVKHARELLGVTNQEETAT
jgi:DNA repair protein RecN (Recombination protein N)